MSPDVANGPWGTKIAPNRQLLLWSKDEDSMQKKVVLHLSEKPAWSCFLPSMTGTIVTYILVYRVFGSWDNHRFIGFIDINKLKIGCKFFLLFNS